MRTGPDGSLWRAVDETLDRQVSVRVVRPGHRYTADVIDAARRAALVEDARLVRVLDVGESNGTAFIVVEHLLGRTLEQLLDDGPVPADTVRRFVGEAAEALDRASTRGLHHLRLTPSSLVIAPDGTVKVIGTAVEAALAGVEQDDDPTGADQVDAVGLVNVLYAGLTGRWPGPVDGPLGSAPRITGTAVPPGELVPGVPGDLDTLCQLTLGPHHDGPQSPGELAERLGPWAPAGPLSDPRGLVVSPSRWSHGDLGSDRRDAAANDEVDDDDEVRAPAGETKGGTPSGAITTAPARASATHRRPGSGNPGRAVAATPASADPVRPDDRTVAPDGRSPGRSDDGGDLPSNGARAGAGDGARGSARGSARNGSGNGGVRGGAWSIFDEPASHEEPLGPFLPPTSLSRPPRDQIRLILAVVAGLVVLGLVLSVFALRGFLSSADPLVEPAPASPTAGAPSGSGVSPSGSPVSSGSPSGSPGSSPTGSPTGSPSGSNATAEITGVQAIDPQGDGHENDTAAALAIDGDQGTSWRSDRYQTAQFGGLKKGLGLYLSLGPGTVHSVVITLPGTGGTVELRTASGPGLDSSAVVSTATGVDGRVTLTPPQPLQVTSLLIWFTELPQQSSGEYRLVVPEIAVT